MATIRAAIVGYGNLGKSAERLIAAQPDMELAGIFSRRESLDTATPVFSYEEFATKAANKDFDVALLCVGSATDIPELATNFVAHAPTVDTYDNHRDIPRHRQAMDEAARAAGTVAIVSTGWDPGMFSLNRSMADAILPDNEQHTFWGPGLSQGHSDALRRIDGVKNAVQYTLPDESALEKARHLKAGDLSGKQAHQRQCWVVLDNDTKDERDRVEEVIRTMPDYFVGYEVEVNFIDDATFIANHTGMPHGGHVITAAETEDGVNHTVEYVLKLGKNPDFTAAVQVAFARAAARLKQQGVTGAFTVLEVAPYLISPTPLEELIARDV